MIPDPRHADLLADETQHSETTRRLGPLRKVTKHLGPDDRLECGHIVPAWGLVAQRRRCRWCRP